MHPLIISTPFGGRSLTLAHVAAQATARARPPTKSVNKWKIFRAVCTARAKLGVSERALTILDALLSFHPDTELSGEHLVVFPSNEQLIIRANGMAPATLRRHLASLVDSGLIVRRDSPNGKRYARKTQDGAITAAFGFDLSPLVARAEELEALAEEIRAEDRALKLVRERLTLCRRDITKLIATGQSENIPVRLEGRGASTWPELQTVYHNIVQRIPRTATRLDLEPIVDELAGLADSILILLETQINAPKLSINESPDERHIQNSESQILVELEPAADATPEPPPQPSPPPSPPPQREFPLSMILTACPDIVDYAKGGISNWRDLQATATVVATMLRISPSAWVEAQSTLGYTATAIAVAVILQKGSAIASAGGYLRALSRQAQTGQFSIGPMLMALIANRQRPQITSNLRTRIGRAT